MVDLVQFGREVQLGHDKLAEGWMQACLMEAYTYSECDVTLRGQIKSAATHFLLYKVPASRKLYTVC